MSRRRLLVSALALALLTPVLMDAQERRRSGGPPTSYDVASERTITATAGESRVMTDAEMMRILTVTVEGRALQLILAPDEFLKQQAFSVAAGSSVTVTGMPGARVNSEPAMLVREIKAGGKTYTLRDKSGKATWEQ